MYFCPLIVCRNSVSRFSSLYSTHPLLAAVLPHFPSEINKVFNYLIKSYVSYISTSVHQDIASLAIKAQGWEMATRKYC